MIRIFLAPIAGITKLPFRGLFWEDGLDYAYTEMISGVALYHRDPKALSLIDIASWEGPVGVQIVGGDPEKVAQGAIIAEKWGASSIDINMGCPARKILKSGGGASLLLSIDKAVRLFCEVKERVSIPVSVKIRKGWKGKEVFLELAKKLEREGVSWITLHARYVEDGSSGPADWDSIKTLKGEVSVPVIGNGGINRPEDAIRMVEITKCDGIMLASGVLRNPLLLRQVRELESKGFYLKETALDKLEWLLRFCSKVKECYSDTRGAKYVKTLVPWVLRDIKGASWLRGYILRLSSLNGIMEVLYSLKSKIGGNEVDRDR
ncbi:MAG: tRNA-dihydrouridine synthase family protein [Synergistetes bacterium]|nr:tRNA-dihydrouridine synthase family protein [Synergistota bacterium]MCX8127679.1 tRNA-dihydrouridine synthase family protein [Synergistota bacterium]MDW8191406.1 tRNA-dihydrouridine synthase family protein [Synergistota bacterium]